MKMTVFFDGAFWAALVEFTDSKGHYKAFRYVFGKEPKDEEVLAFVHFSLGKWLRRYESIEIADQNLSAPAISQKKTNPKRMQREINKAKKQPVLSTKAQQAMQEMHEALKKKSKAQAKQAREQQKELIYRLKQEKRRQKKKGH